MPQTIQLSTIIPVTLSGMRLDQALAQIFPEHSRARLTKWIKQQYITVNGKYLNPKDKVYGGESINIAAILTDETVWEPQALELAIIYEDDSILVINKPQGLVVHPAAGHFDNTLVNALLHHCPALTNLPRAGLIHRLDKDTTGLLVIAKTLTAHTALVAAMQQRQISREYQALVYGHVRSSGTISTAMGRHPRNRLKRAVLATGKLAVTHYQVLRHYPGFTLLAVQLETGRTHQIRVHLTHINHPIVGDPLYGNKPKALPTSTPEVLDAIQKFKRQALHAYQLKFIHPHTQQPLQFSAPIPQDMQQLLNVLEQ